MWTNLILLASAATCVVCAYSLLLRRSAHLFGSEAIRDRLRFPHVMAIIGGLAALGLLLPESWFSGMTMQPALELNESVFLGLATVLVLFMLFGFVAFEAGTVSAAYRNQSAEKNLLVVMFSLFAYLMIGRHVYDGVAGTPLALSASEPMAVTFQAGFACTVALILSNSLTERASRSTILLCAVFAAGFGYPILAGLVWGEQGALRQIGFIDASGASVVHLLGASASLFAAAAVGPRMRLQRRQFLHWPETPDFRSPWSVVGGLFLMFGWLGFNSGSAEETMRGHALFNTMIGACAGTIAAWTLSRGTDAVAKWTRWFDNPKSKQGVSSEVIREIVTRPRIVIGMMGGLVAVTANGALPEIGAGIAIFEAFLGGLVAVVVSTWMSTRRCSQYIDDPLGAIATHGCAAFVGIVCTAIGLAHANAGSLELLLAAQLIGCGVCIVIGWLVAMIPCWLLLTTEQRALRKNSRLAATFRLRLGAIEQLGTPREIPLDLEWNDRIEEARRRIVGNDKSGDSWWDAVETCAAAADVLDKSTQADIAHQIVQKLHETEDWRRAERIALVALVGSAEYARVDDIGFALDECLMRAGSNGQVDASVDARERAELLVWSVAVLTERATALARGARPEILADAKRGLKFLRQKVTESDSSVKIRDLARIGIIDSNARFFDTRATALHRSNGESPQDLRIGQFDSGGRWQAVYALVVNEDALPMLLCLGERGVATITSAADELEITRDEARAVAGALASQYLVSMSMDGEEITIKPRGRDLVSRLQEVNMV